MDNAEKIGLTALILGGAAIVLFEVFNNKQSNNAMPSISGSVNGNIATITGSGFTSNGSVQLDENNQQLETITASSTGTISTTLTISTSGLSNGTYNYTFQAFDLSSNNPSNTITIKMSITGETSQVNPQITGNLNGDVVQIKGTGFTANGNVDLSENSMNISTITANSGGNISTDVSISTNNLGAGTYTFTYQCYDIDSNSYSNTLTETLTITGSSNSSSNSNTSSTSTSTSTSVSTSTSSVSTSTSSISLSFSTTVISTGEVITIFVNGLQTGESWTLMEQDGGYITAPQLASVISYNASIDSPLYQSLPGTFYVYSDTGVISNKVSLSSNSNQTSTSSSISTSSIVGLDQSGTLSASTSAIQLVNGSAITFTGSGFPSYSSFYISGGTSSDAESGIEIAQGQADASGNFTVSTSYSYGASGVDGLANAFNQNGELNEIYVFAYDYNSGLYSNRIKITGYS